MASVIPFGSDQFRLRLTLDNPLPLVGDGRSPRPFDRYLAELVRDKDERVCAFINAYFLSPRAVRGSYTRAAEVLGSKYLARVCLEALDASGRVLEHIEDALDGAMIDVYVFDGMNIVEEDASRPVLRGIFVRELLSLLSRGVDGFFINAPEVDFAFWRDTLGARKIDEFIVALGGRPLPVYPRRSG